MTPEGSVAVGVTFSATLPTFVRVRSIVAEEPEVLVRLDELHGRGNAVDRRHRERHGLRLRDRRIGRAGRGDGERDWVPGGRDRLAGVRLQVEAEDSRLTGRDRDARAAVQEREAAGDVREGEVVGVGGRAEVLDRGAEGRGELRAVEGDGEDRVGMRR